MEAHGVPLNTLKECLQFLQWLNKNTMTEQVARELANRISDKYKGVTSRNIQSELSRFLGHVSKFYTKLCHHPAAGNYEGKNVQHITEALLECIPKLLAALYYLWYDVNATFGTLGGGGWKMDYPGYEREWKLWSSSGGDLQKYFRATVGGSDDYGGMIPGGFGFQEVRHGDDWYGYYQGYLMEGDIKSILDKQKNQIFRDIFATSVVSKSGLHKVNTANALALVRSFCGIVNAEKSAMKGGELKANLDDDLHIHLKTKDKSICWQQLRSHCAVLQDQFSKIYTRPLFSFTGYGREVGDLKKTEFAKEAANWLRKYLPTVKEKLNNIKNFESKILNHNANQLKSSSILRPDLSKLFSEYFITNLFPYGFTFEGNQYETTTTPYEVLFRNWHEVIGILNRQDDGLNKLKTILDGQQCPKEEDEKHEYEEFSESPKEVVPEKKVPVTPPKKPEVPPAKVPEVPKEPERAQNQGKKAEGAQNQGKKSEGAQNQGKKSEGAQNQGKKSEGAQNQGKSRSAEKSASSHSSPSGAPGSGSGTAPSVRRSPDATQTSGQESETGKAVSTRTPIGPRSGIGVGAKPNAGESTDHDSGQKSATPQCEAGQTLTDGWKGGNKICISEERLKKAKYWESAWTKANEAKNKEEADERKEKAAYEQYKLQMNQMTNYPLSLDGYDLKSPLDGADLPDDSRIQNRQKLDANFKIAYEKILQNQTRADDNMNNKIFQSEQRGKADEHAWIKREHNQDISLHGFKVKPSRHGSPIPSPSGLTGQVVSDASKNERSNHDDAVNQYKQQWKQSEERILSADGSHISPPLEGKALPDISDLLLHKQNEAEDKWAELNSGPFVQNAKYDEVFGNKFPKKKRTLHSQLTPFLTGNYVPDELRAYRLNENIEKAKDALKRIYARNEYQRRNFELIGLPTADSKGISRSMPLQAPAFNGIPMGYQIKPPMVIDQPPGTGQLDVYTVDTLTDVNGAVITNLPPKGPNDNDPSDVHFITTVMPLVSSTQQSSAYEPEVDSPKLKPEILPPAPPHPTINLEVKKAYDSVKAYEASLQSNAQIPVDFIEPVLPADGFPDIPLDPPRLATIHELAVFPNSYRCLDPWSVTRSSVSTTAPTLFHPPHSDNVPLPQTIREMLFWLVGFNTYGLIARIERHIEGLLMEFNSDASHPKNGLEVTGNISFLPASHIADKLTEACLYSASVLYSIKHINNKDSFFNFNFESVYSQLRYSPDPACLLCQLRDYVYACCHQLQFLKAQCKRDKLSGGWSNYDYGSDLKTSSPLQAFLTDGWDSDFETHLFDPCNLCHKSRVRIGFSDKDLPDKSQTGTTLSSILTPSCGGEGNDSRLDTILIIAISGHDILC